MTYRSLVRTVLLLPLCLAYQPSFALADSGALEESLRQAEISFAESLAKGDQEAFAAHIAPNAVFVSGPPLVGRDAILAAWSVYFGDSAPKLRWHPEVSIVQPSGKLGFSRGPYTLEMTGPDGEVSVQSGEFMSIWELQEDGSWRVIFDSGCRPCQCSDE